MGNPICRHKRIFGFTLFVNNVATNAQRQAWRQLSEEHGAVAHFFYGGDKGFSYFLDEQMAANFAYDGENGKGQPNVFDHTREYRVRFDARVKSFSGQPLTARDVWLLQNRYHY